MALSLDDKLLGEKTQYYCSSSEEEEGEEDEDTQPEQPAAATVPEPEFRGYGGTCTNTGPKGVINDWRQFKKLETEKREEAERERKALLQKLSMTCRSHLDDETEKSQDEHFLQQIEREMEEFEDEFMKEYREKRIEEMRKALGAVPKFGRLHSLSPGDFTDAIDKENPGVTVIVHLYEDRVSACESMNSCLQCLAQEYPTVKFCRMRASDAKLSIKFALSGVPALLVYKNKELIGNFIRLSDEFGSEIFASDVESFLDEHGFLPNKDVSKAIRDSTTGELRSRLPGDSLSDSDYDVD